jgi:hypothetical protein
VEDILEQGKRAYIALGVTCRAKKHGLANVVLREASLICVKILIQERREDEEQIIEKKGPHQKEKVREWNFEIL